ncbi:MAG: pro-sigmaK processing inhibitor BofA [Firmicutes bacterium]|nr:pro-sigmaK processing inhibitor BofA [Bacillota bacterium]
MPFETVLAYFFLLLFLYASTRLLAGPLRVIFDFLYHFFLGMGLLWTANAIGRHFGATLALNPYTALVAGFLHIPGILLLFLLKFWLLP